MTRIAHLLEDFSQIGAARRDSDLALSEDRRLEVFEEGYSAGWADAAKAYTEDRTRADMTIAAAVSDMAFTFHEAQNAMLQALAPFLGQLVDTVLPEMARQGLGLQVREALLAALTRDHPPDAMISARPDTLEAIRRALPDPAPMPLRLQPDPTLADGQVILRIGQREQEINNEALLTQIRDAMAAFFATEPKEARYG
jgi:flagellar assembly protein FliH